MGVFKFQYIQKKGVPILKLLAKTGKSKTPNKKAKGSKKKDKKEGGAGLNEFAGNKKVVRKRKKKIVEQASLKEEKVEIFSQDNAGKVEGSKEANSNASENKNVRNLISQEANLEKASSKELKVNEEDFQNELKSIEKANVVKYRFSKDLEGFINGNLQDEDIFGSQLMKKGSLIPLVEKEAELSHSKLEGQSASENKGFDKMFPSANEENPHQILLNAEVSKREMMRKGSNFEDSYVGDKESTLLNSMLIEKGENSENFFKRGTIVGGSLASDKPLQLLNPLGMIVSEQIQEEKEEFSIQTGGFPSEKKKKKSSNFEEKFKKDFDNNNPFLLKAEDENEPVRPRVRSEFKKSSFKDSAGLARVKSEKKVRFAAEKEEFNSNLSNDSKASDLTQQDEQIFEKNVKTQKQQKSKKGKTFIETMQNIFKDLDQTLNEVEIVNNETSLEENKVLKFEYEGLDAGQMEPRRGMFDSTESEGEDREPEAKEDPEQILKKADMSGIDLQVFEKKPKPQKPPEPSQEPQKKEPVVPPETEKKPAQLEIPLEENSKKNNHQYSNLLSRYMRVSPKIYKSRRKGDNKYIINVENNTSEYASVGLNDIKSIKKSATEETSEHAYFSVKNNFRPKQFTIRTTAKAPPPSKRRNPWTRKGVSSLRTSPKKRLHFPQDRFSKKHTQDSKHSFSIREYDTPLKYKRFIKETGSQPQSRREFKFLKQNRGNNRSTTSSRVSPSPGASRFVSSSVDIESKIRVLFKKLFVYLSKIENIKMKLYKNCDESLTYAFFQKFANQQTKQFDLVSFKKLFHFLNLDVKDSAISKTILYLNKFRPPRPNPLLLSESLTAEQSGQWSLDYPHFRELFMSHKIRSSEAYLSSEWQSVSLTQEPIIRQPDYFLLRQILILFGRQIRDVSRVILSLREHSPRAVMDYMLSFKRNSKFDLSNFRSLSVSPSPSPGVSFGNNKAFGLEEADTPKGSKLMNSIQEKDESRSNVPASSQQEKSFSRNQTLGSRVLNRFYKFSSEYKSVPAHGQVKSSDLDLSESPRQNEPLGFRHLRQINLNTEPEAEETSLDLGHLKILLAHLDIEYLKEDLYLLMNHLGAQSGFLSQSQFALFFNSTVWDIN